MPVAFWARPRDFGGRGAGPELCCKEAGPDLVPQKDHCHVPFHFLGTSPSPSRQVALCSFRDSPDPTILLAAGQEFPLPGRLERLGWRGGCTRSPSRTRIGSPLCCPLFGPPIRAHSGRSVRVRAQVAGPEGLGRGMGSGGRPALCPAQCAPRTSSSAATARAWPPCSCATATMTAATAATSAAVPTRPAGPASSAAAATAAPASPSAGSVTANSTARTARTRRPSSAATRAPGPRPRPPPAPQPPSSPAAAASACTWAGAATATATARTSRTRPTAVSPRPPLGTAQPRALHPGRRTGGCPPPAEGPLCPAALTIAMF